MILGDIASIATLVLFVFYFVGRAIAIVRNRNVFLDDIRIEHSDFDQSKLDIVECFKLEPNPYNAFVLTSEQGIYDLSVYQILYDEDCHRTGRKKVEGFTYDFLNKGQSLAFFLTSPELFVTYEVEYYTQDYKKVTISLWDNPKNGVMSESAIPQNTFKSVMYNLVK